MIKQAEKNMKEQKINYILEIEGKVYIVENVPARVDEETGEQFFAPSTVEHLRETILNRTKKPKRITKAPVYDYSEVTN